MSLKASPAQQLDPGMRTILTLAALFSTPFSIDWLMELAQEKVSQVIQALDHGVAQGWLEGQGAGRYRFIDALERKRLLAAVSAADNVQPAWTTTCRQAAVILMRELPDGAEKAMAVAELLLGLGNDRKGCQQLVAAGDLFRRRFESITALRCYEKALEDLDRLGRSEDADQLVTTATIQYSKLFSATTDAERILTALKKAIAIAAEHRWTARWSLLKMHLAKQLWLGSRHASALTHFNEGWAAGRAIEDVGYRRSARVFSMYFLFWQGRFKEAVASYEGYMPEIEDLPEAAFPLMARITIGVCYVHCGNVAKGVGMLEALRESCTRKGNLSKAAHALLNIGLSCSETGRIEEGLPHFETALSYGRESHDVLVEIGALLGLAYCHLKIKQPRRTLDYLQRFKALSKDAHMGVRNVPVVMEICWAMETGELPKVAGFSLDEEIAQTLRSRSVYMRGMAYLYRARLRKRRIGVTSAATASEVAVIKDLRKAVDLMDTAGHRFHLAVAQLDLAREWFHTGREAAARDLAGPAAQYLLVANSALVPEDLHPLLRHLRTEKNLIAEMMALSQDLVSLKADGDLVGRVLSTASRLTGAERGAIFVRDDVKAAFTLKASQNMSAADVSDPAFDVSREVITITFDTAEGRVASFADAPADGAEPRAIRACICVPMRLREEIVGVLYLDNRIFPSAFDGEDIPVLDYFAAQASIAMENARAYSLLQTRYLKQKEELHHHERQYLERLHFDEMVGQSTPIRRVFGQIDRVAPTDATVLIHGETGVGKELVARAVHRSSPRKDGPFIRVNCSAFSEHLIASELFGHEKGAFTGASQTHLGRFELAHGGTLFLDEIGDIPSAVQVRLLRVLQSHEFERVGGQTTLRSDFRLMVATNRDLLAAVSAGTFRQDLYYRLNVFPIEVPPLRARGDDIPLLAEYFLNKYARQYGKTVAPIPAKLATRLAAYPWPGNVRELENYVERAVILSRGDRLQLPEAGLAAAAPSEALSMVSHAENERGHIIRALKLVGGKVAGPGGAAELIELHPNTLRYRIKKLGIRAEDWVG